MVLLCMILFGRGVQTRRGRIMDLVDFRKGSKPPASKMTTATIEQKVTIENYQDGHWDGDGDGDGDDTGRNPLHWLKYKQ